MSRLRVNAFGVSVDGYGAGPSQDLANPMGVGGMALHQWVLGTKTFQKMAGGFAESLIGGQAPREDVDDRFAARGFENLGAWILGRNMFGPVRGGRTTAGRAGGATTRPTTCRSSSSRTTRARRSRWPAE